MALSSGPTDQGQLQATIERYLKDYQAYDTLGPYLFEDVPADRLEWADSSFATVDFWLALTGKDIQRIEIDRLDQLGDPVPLDERYEISSQQLDDYLNDQHVLKIDYGSFHYSHQAVALPDAGTIHVVQSIGREDRSALVTERLGAWVQSISKETFRERIKQLEAGDLSLFEFQLRCDEGLGARSNDDELGGVEVALYAYPRRPSDVIRLPDLNQYQDILSPSS